MTEVVEIDQKELQIDQVIQHTASGEESAAASEELSVQAAQMLEMMKKFRYIELNNYEIY